jgi:L-arabinonolactonase
MMELVVDGRNILGEGIVWDDKGARLFWTDIEGSELWAHAPATGALVRLSVV